jgi:hypothetical protein
MSQVRSEVRLWYVTPCGLLDNVSEGPAVASPEELHPTYQATLCHIQEDSSEKLKYDLCDMPYLQQSAISTQEFTLLQTVPLMKNAVFWAVTQCGSCKNSRLGGT